MSGWLSPDVLMEDEPAFGIWRRDELDHRAQVDGHRRPTRAGGAVEAVGTTPRRASRRGEDKGPSYIPDPSKHGTTTGYNYGCRCGPCREAKRMSSRAYRDRVRWMTP